MSKLLGKGDYLGGWNNKKYLILSILNHGSYGTVYAARNSRSLQKVAIKQISKDTQTIELDILTRLRKANSRNLIKLIDSFSDKHSSYIVNDFCTLGDLYEVIAADRVPDDTQTIKDLILQLISSVEACHSVGVYHRDIKPENIFLTVEETKATVAGDGEVVLKLGDFGLATCEEFSTEIGTGSDRYMAPEQYKPTEAGAGYSPIQADIWSLGIVIMNTLFSRNPWKQPTEDDPVFRDFLRDPESLFEHFVDLTQDTFKVIRCALHMDPSMRSLDRMKAAVMEVLDWRQATDVLPSIIVSRRNSTNLAEYDTTGPTAGRGPLRTPSVAQTAKLQSSCLGSFSWSKALASSEEDHRNGLGFAKPARKQGSDLASSWRRPAHKDLSSLDSGLGTSFSSFSPHKLSIPLAKRGAIDVKQFASSAPSARIQFPEPSPNKGHLKFGRSWADQDSESDDDDDEFTRPAWSDRRTSAIHEADEETERHSSSGARSSLEDGELFAFEEGEISSNNTSPDTKK